MARIGRYVAHGVQTSSVECLDALVDAVGSLARAAALEDEFGLGHTLVVHLQVGGHVGAAAEQTVVAEDGGTGKGDGLGLNLTKVDFRHDSTYHASISDKQKKERH